MAGRWRRTIIVGLLIGAACTKQLALLELLFQVSDAAGSQSIPQMADHMLTNPCVFFLIVASTTFFVDPTNNQIAINSAVSSATSRPQTSTSTNTPSSSSSSTSSNNAATIGGAVGGGIGALIIICLLTYIFLQKRKGKPKPTMTATTVSDGSTAHVLKPELHGEEGSVSGREEHDVVPHVDPKDQSQTTTVRELELDSTGRQRQPTTPVELVAGRDIRPLGKTAELSG